MATNWRGPGTGCTSSAGSRPYDVRYIVIDPGMPGNRGSEHWRVAESRAYNAYLDKGKTPPIMLAFTSFEAAAERRDRLNTPLYPPATGELPSAGMPQPAETDSDAAAAAAIKDHLAHHPPVLADPFAPRFARPSFTLGGYGPLPADVPTEES